MGAVELGTIGPDRTPAHTADDAITPAYNDDSPDDLKALAEPIQVGVRYFEAITLIWSKRTLIAVFIKYVMLSLRQASPHARQLT
jgi:hypothetical protein